MVRLTREAILATQLARELVHVPEWGGSVYVQEMSGELRDSWEHAVMANRDNARAITVVRTTVDENGVRIFKDEDAEELGKKSAGALSRIAEVSRRLSKLGVQEVEDVKGNFEPDRSDDSASA